MLARAKISPQPLIETNTEGKFKIEIMSEGLQFTWYGMACEKCPCVDETFKQGCFKLDGTGPILGLYREDEVCNSDAIVTSCSFAVCHPMLHIARSSWAMFCLQEKPR